MSPERTTSVSVIARLRREIAHDRSAIDRHAAEIRGLRSEWPEKQNERSAQAHAAVALHAWYTGLETLLERVARQVDAEVPRGDSSHRDLLFQCSAEVPGIRPAILSEALVQELSELLGFRHFFRHAYAVDLDPARLALQLSRVERIAPEVSEALDRFDVFLIETTRRLQAP